MLRYGWSLNKDQWNAISPELLETPWRSVKFSIDSSELVPQKRGVYLVSLSVEGLISAEPFANFTSPLYVGHTTRLRQRFRQHAIGNKPGNLRSKGNIFTKYMTFYFALFEDYTKDELKKMEQSLIDVYGPPLNSINSISQGVITEDSISGSLIIGD